MISPHSPNMSSVSYNVTTDVYGESNGTDPGAGEMAGPGLERIILPIIFGLIVLFGAIGNTLVIVVVVKNKAYSRTTTNLFILNLALADLSFLLFCVPFHLVIYTATSWPFGNFMCKAVHLLQYWSMVASILTLVAMSTERYLAVAHPLNTKHLRTPSVALGVSVLVWLLSLGIALPWPFIYFTREYPGPDNSTFVVCADDWSVIGATKTHRAAYYLVLFLVSYAIPLVVITVMSSMMVYQLWLMRWPEGACHEESLKAKRKVTRLVIVVVIVFFVCWGPSHVCWLWSNYGRGSWRPTYAFFYLKVFSHALAYGNSSMNPIIYAFMSANFRRGFAKALRFTATRINPVLQAGSKTVYSLCHDETGATMDTAVWTQDLIWRGIFSI